MEILTLNGAWTVTQDDTGEKTKASVPGCVHGDLLHAKKIIDPFFRDNEKDLQWIGQKNWTYTRDFKASPALLSHKKVMLRCHSLDTFCELKINGKRVGKTDNQFRIYEFDVKKYLKTGKNSIVAKFTSVIPYIEKKNKQRYLPMWGRAIMGGNWVRKSQSNFGWDWNATLNTCGIPRDIELVAFDAARIDEVHVMQKHTKKSVSLDVNIAAELAGGKKLSAAVTVSFKGKKVAEETLALKGGKACAKIKVNNPKLWWPNGMGEQHLYDVSVELLDKEECLLDAWNKRIGLRTLHIERKKDKWGECFQFVCNGISFFAKGANWIPPHTLPTEATDKQYRYLLESSAAVNMNMLRVWGGGIFEPDLFYDICDELGLCLWHDFMFACATYPTFDDEWIENVKIECEDNIKRLRHHASLAVWCGNNELEQGLVGDEWTNNQMSWEAYEKLFKHILAKLVKKHDPQTDYWQGSPHTPVGNRKDGQDPDSGDAHVWVVWFGGAQMEEYRNCGHRFNSEFGFQCYPSPKTVRAFTEPEDRNVTSYIMDYHQRSGTGSKPIFEHMVNWFRMPTSFDDTLWVSQLLQGVGIQYGVEHWRRSMPRGMGTLFWQVNDCWPVVSWASIDFFGRWKAMHYMARRFFAPVLVSTVNTPYTHGYGMPPLENDETGLVEIHVTSDLLKDTTGKLSWTLTDVDGREIITHSKNVKIASRKNKMVEKLDVRDVLENYGKGETLLWVSLTKGKEVLSENIVTFMRPKHVSLKDPDIKVIAKQRRDGSFFAEVTAKKPALWTWLDLSKDDALYSDNFFHLNKGQKRIIEITPAKEMTLAQIKKQLSARSLWDTFQ